MNINIYILLFMKKKIKRLNSETLIMNMHNEIQKKMCRPFKFLNLGKESGFHLINLIKKLF